MSTADTNMATLKATYDAYGQGDPAPLFDALDEKNFVMHEHSRSKTTPWGGTWVGRAGMQDFIGAVTAHMAHKAYVCDGMTAQGDDLVVSWGHFDTECIHTRNGSRHKWMHMVRFRDGKIAEIDEFYDSLALMEDLAGRSA